MSSLAVDMELGRHPLALQFGVVEGSEDGPVAIVMGDGDKGRWCLGVNLDQGIKLGGILAGAAKVGEHKTSMLQDVETGRPMELEAIVGAVIELGEIVGVQTPNIRAVYAAAKLLGENVAKQGGVRPAR